MKSKAQEGADAIVNALHKREALALVSDVLEDFLLLLNTKWSQNESFKNFESRFEVQVSKFHSHSDSAKLAEALVALMLLAHSNVDDNQRIFVLAASSPRAESLNDSSSTSEFLEILSYSSIASVIRQSDKPRSSGQSSDHISSRSLQAISPRTAKPHSKTK